MDSSSEGDVSTKSVLVGTLTTTLLVFTVKEVAADPERIVNVMAGEVRLMGVSALQLRAAAWTPSKDPKNKKTGRSATIMPKKDARGKERSGRIVITLYHMVSGSSILSPSCSGPAGGPGRWVVGAGLSCAPVPETPRAHGHYPLVGSTICQVLTEYWRWVYFSP